MRHRVNKITDWVVVGVFAYLAAYLVVCGAIVYIVIHFLSKLW